MSDAEEHDRDDRDSPGASSPGEPGYEGEVTVGDDGFEGLDPDADQPDESSPRT